jgi:hypothetical protein
MPSFLVEWTRTLQQSGSAGLISLVCIVAALIGSRFGLYYSPPSRIQDTMRSGDDWAIAREMVRQALKTSVFFGLITIPVVIWDRSWLTLPALLFFGAVAIFSLIQAAFPMLAWPFILIAKPHSAVPITLATVARILSEAAQLLYVGLLLAAFLT